MPTKNPRMAVTLPPKVYQAYMELAEESGMAASTFAAQILIESVPMVRMLTKTYKLAKTSPAKAADQIEEAVAKSMLNMAQKSMEFNTEVTPKLRKAPRKKKND